MTREEAIDHLEDLKDEYDDFPGDKEALIMAIEALKEVEKWREYKAECDSYHTK